MILVFRKYHSPTPGTAPFLPRARIPLLETLLPRPTKKCVTGTRSWGRFQRQGWRPAIGAGFDIEQIRSLISALIQFGDGVISFAHDEDIGPGQFDGKVIIGAYGEESHGIEIEKAKILLDNPEASITDAYRIFGK